MSDRREFVKISLLSSAALLSGSKLSAQQKIPDEKKYNTTKGKPVVISTWDFGQAANAGAWSVLEQYGKAIDAVEAGVKIPEANPFNQSVGYGGRPDRDGRVTLDACIMDEQGKCGSVACIEHIKHPISVARMVMERTPHVMLVGDGALQFALANGFKREKLLTSQSERDWREWLKREKYAPQKNIENRMPGGADNHDTIGMIAIDMKGNISGACTTSGMAYKMHGRVGDSPIIGAGLYVDNEVGAATGTGVGEEVIRIVGAHLIVELMRMGLTPEAACKRAIERIAANNPGNPNDIQVGFLALNKHGEYGAYALQKGFSYSVKNGHEDVVLEAKHLL
ncbi:MAG: N(4)-(beta-N-acetylglucosaminyl)-L-asparaginase [Taibaiella sp.]|nr:N(4)-(beta-N-acetylglucosaminyl)-L-asparaginase [Taibaiella sp.]